MASDLAMAVDITARNYRDEEGSRGFSAMAKAIGQNPHYFSNKVSAGCENAHLDPDELLAVMGIANDYSILHAMARNCRKPHVCIELADYRNVSDIELLDAHLQLQKELGETADVIRQALSVGHISKKDFAEIDREIHEDVTCMYELRARLQGMLR